MRLVPILLLPFVSCGIGGLAAQTNEKLIPAQAELQLSSGVDLGIADDETYRRPNSWSQNDTVAPDGTAPTRYAEAQPLLPTERLLGGGFSGPASRPGMSIAWRNAQQVEEVEVRIRNLGDQPGEGRVWVDVLDEEGVLLLRLEPPEELRVIRVPAFGMGGREGKVLRMKASRALNNLIDRYDNERRRYDIRATVETLQVADVNPFDNSKTKSWNVAHGVRPQMRNTFNYVFRNTESTPVTVHWLLERTPYPEGWTIAGVPADATPFVLNPGERVSGFLWLDAPVSIQEGAFVEARLSLVREDTGAVFGQHEWFQVYDTTPPTVTDYRLILTNRHQIAISALVADNGSGVLEATGVTSEWSTDGGRTWARMAHNYRTGNFVVPTLFEAMLGPFAPDTDVQLRFTAKDTAGNVTALIPDDAAALRAPAGAETILDLAYIYPRQLANPIFQVDPGPVDLKALTEEFAASIAATATSEDHLSEIRLAMQAMGFDPVLRTRLQDAATILMGDPERKVIGVQLMALATETPPTTLATAPIPSSAVLTTVDITRVQSPGSELLNMNTIGLKIQ